MTTPFVMPKAGITMDEGTIVSWLIKPGDAFKTGDPLAVVETDKATVEIAANADGKLLRILVTDGQTVAVGTPIAELADGTESAAAPAAPAQAAPSGERLRISPLARQLAARLGVNPAQVHGSGPGGRILRHDIEAAAAHARVAVPAPAQAAQAAPAPAAPTVGSGDRRLSLTRMRRIIAERMTLSSTTIPQFRVNLAADLTAINRLRQALAPLKVKVSVTDFLVQACAQALKAHPQVNASWLPGATMDESAVVQHEAVNIGLAVAIEGGLVVPVIKDAAGLSLAALGREREALVAAAQSGKATPDQLSGGTFTISNLGTFGIDSFDAIVNPPEAAILAVGRVADTPVASDGKVEIRPMMALTLTVDHRVLDGADAARFLRTVVDKLEKADEFRLL